MRRENHIGDWGTPFGMLIEHLIDVGGAADAESFSVRDLNEFYARRAGSSTPTRPSPSGAGGASCSSRAATTRRCGCGGSSWPESMRHAREVYDLLGVLLTDDDIVGESFYNPLLPVVVDELDAKGLLVEDDGALCVFPEGFENRNGEPLPLIVRKSDGGYGYPATDLACVRDRTGRLGATRLIYVVGAEQSLHLRLVFAVAALAGYLPDAAAAVHVAFGLVLGTDGKKLASRSGGSERLVDLLAEGIERAEAALKERSSDLSPERQAATAHALGVGRGQVRRPVHRARPRLRLRLGPDARLRGRHRAVPAVRARPHPLHLPACRGGAAAARRRRRCSASPRSARWPCSCSRFAEAVEATAETYSPSKLCTYLFDLATVFTGFYEACRVLVDDEVGALVAPRAVRPDGAGCSSRGSRCSGIEAPEQM